MSLTDTVEDTLREVRAALRSDTRLGTGFRPDLLTLDEDGTLTIAGDMPSVAAKKRALEHAAAPPAVRAVVDRLRVTPASHMGDAEIRAHLRDFFTREPAFAGYAVRQMRNINPDAAYPVEFETVTGDPLTSPACIDVEVHDGVVILNGRIPSLTGKRLAGVMAWWVPGVRDVVNGLEVDPPEEDAPIRIEEAVRVALERDPVVDDSQIRVGVRDRTVRLQGTVASDELRDMAERDAWYVFGVDEVINEISVEP